MSKTTPTNPKDAIGRQKLPLRLWPAAATALGSLAMLEGALKYGRNNFRAAPVLASVYVEACKRHLDLWFEGEDADPNTGLSHLGYALACVAILVDAGMERKLIDDRNFSNEAGTYSALVADLRKVQAQIVQKFEGRAETDGYAHFDRRDNLVPEPPNSEDLSRMATEGGTSRPRRGRR